MKERINRFIEEKKITAAEFADSIGVQRSSVSHVLNGRNNPGFSFIQKILEAYPNLNSRWLLTGTGSMLDKTESPEKQKDNNLFSTATIQEKKAEQTKTQRPDNKVINPKNEPVLKDEDPPAYQVSKKKVTRVLIFYNDHTFEDFRPSE